MTTKTKPRKPAAKDAAPDATVKGEAKPGNDIRALTAKARLIEAERDYAEASGTSDRLPWPNHNRQTVEESEIKSRLAAAVPKNFAEVVALLDYVTAALAAKTSVLDPTPPEIKMLKNLRRGIQLAELHMYGEYVFKKTRAVMSAKEKLVLSDTD